MLSLLSLFIDQLKSLVVSSILDYLKLIFKRFLKQPKPIPKKYTGLQVSLKRLDGRYSFLTEDMTLFEISLKNDSRIYAEIYKSDLKNVKSLKLTNRKAYRLMLRSNITKTIDIVSFNLDDLEITLKELSYS